MLNDLLFSVDYGTMLHGFCQLIGSFCDNYFDTYHLPQHKPLFPVPCSLKARTALAC